MSADDCGHDDYAVKVPAGVPTEDVTDFVQGWFRAEIQIISCGQCGHEQIGWRDAKPCPANQSKPSGYDGARMATHEEAVASENVGGGGSFVAPTNTQFPSKAKPEGETK